MTKGLQTSQKTQGNPSKSNSSTGMCQLHGYECCSSRHSKTTQYWNKRDNPQEEESAQGMASLPEEIAPKGNIPE